MSETTYFIDPELEPRTQPEAPKAFVKWSDVVATPEYEEATDARRLQTFENWNDYAVNYLTQLHDQAPEEKKPEYRSALEKQIEWAKNQFGDLAKNYSLPGKLTNMGDDLGQIRSFLQDPDALVAEGYDAEEVQKARDLVFEANKEVFRMSIGAVAPDSPQAKVDYNDPTFGEYGESQRPLVLNDEELQQKFWEDPSWTDMARTTVNQLGAQTAAVTLRWMSGLADAVDRWGWVLGSDTDPEEESVYESISESLGDSEKQFTQSNPMDPRIGSDTASFIQGVTQMPAQLAPYMLGGPALGAVTTFGQLYKENLDRGLEDEKFIAFETAKEAGSLPPGTSFQQWESSLSETQIDDYKAAAAGRAALLAIPQTGVEYFQNLFLLGRIPMEKVPGGKVLATMLGGARRSAPKLTTGAMVAANLLAKGASEGGEEVLQQGMSNLQSGLVRGDYAGGLRDPAKSDPEKKSLPLLGMPWGDNYTFQDARQAFFGGLGGGFVGGVMSTPKVLQEARTFEWARSMVEETGKAFESRNVLLEAVKATRGEESTQYKDQVRAFEAQRDEAHWILRRMGDPAADAARAERAENRFKADKTYLTNFAKWAADNNVGYEDDREIGGWVASRIQKSREQFRNLRMSLGQNGLTEAGKAIPEAEAEAEAKILAEGEERAKKSAEALARFKGTVDTSAPGRADYARTVLTRMFPEFTYSEEYKNDDVVVAVLDAYESGQLQEGANVSEWLLQPPQQEQDNAKEQTKVSTPVEGQTLSPTSSPVQGTGAGVQEGVAPSSQSQPPIPITLRDDDGKVVADEAGMPVQMTDRNFFDEYQTILGDLSDETKAVTPERIDAHLKDVNRLLSFIDKAPELTDEQKQGWKAPFEGLASWLQNEASTLSKTSEKPPSSDESGTAQVEESQPVSALQRAADVQQPMRLGSQKGTLILGEEGRPLFKPDSGGPEIELRVREESAAKEPSELLPEDFASESDPIVPLDANKKFSVLPPNEPGALRPVFISASPAAPSADATKLRDDLISGNESAETHRATKGKKTLISREAASAVLASIPEGDLTRKGILDATKEIRTKLGISTPTILKIAALRDSGPGISSRLLSGELDEAVGLFDRANPPAPPTQQDTTSEKPKTEDTKAALPTGEQSGSERWVMEAFQALESKASSLKGKQYREFKQALATDEGRASIQRALGGIYSRSLDKMLLAKGISDPVVREDFLDRILRGRASETNPGQNTQSVLGDLMSNLESTGDPFKTSNGSPYSAWMSRGRNQVKGAFTEQSSRLTPLPVEDGRTDEGIGGGRRLGGGISLSGDPGRDAAKAEFEELKNQATQKGILSIAEEYASSLGESVGDTRVALAHLLKESLPPKMRKNIDVAALGWSTPGSRVKQTVLQKFSGIENEAVSKLVGALRSSLQEATEFAKSEGLLSSEATFLPGEEMSLADIVSIGIAEEMDATEAASKARESKSLTPLLPALQRIHESPSQARLLSGVISTVLNNGKPMTSAQIAKLSRSDMDRVLESPVLPNSVKQVLSAVNELGGDPLRYVAENGENEGYRRLAELYAEQRAKSPVRGDLFFNLALIPKAGTALGLWDSDTNTAQVSPFLPGASLEATILHEAMHPIWDWKIRVFEKDPLSTLLSESERSALADLVRLKDIAETEALARISKAQAEGAPEEQILRMRRDLLGSFRNNRIKMSEFLNDALNHKPFQNFLAELKDSKDPGDKTLLKRILNAIIRLISGRNVAFDSVLQKAFETSLELATDTRSPGMPISERNSLQVEYFKDLETQTGVPVSDWTDAQKEMAAMNFELAYPKEASYPTDLDEAKDFAPSVLSSGEASAFANFLDRIENPIMPSMVGVEFVSPNEQDDLKFEGATALLSDPQQQQLKDFGAKIHEAFGLPRSRMVDALGDWADGAEPTTLTEHFDESLSYEDIKVIAALKGAIKNQKAVIPFKLDDTGSSFLYDFFIPDSNLTEARNIVSEAGIEFRTLVEQNGGVRVLLFDIDGTAFDAFANLVTQNNYEASINRGTGEFLGSWDSREEGRSIYARTVAQASRISGNQDSELGPDSPESLRASRIRELAKEAGLDLDASLEAEVFQAVTGQPPSPEEQNKIAESSPVVALEKLINNENQKIIRTLDPDSRSASYLRAAAFRYQGRASDQGPKGLRGLPRQLRLSLATVGSERREAASTDRLGNVRVDVPKLKAGLFHEEGTPEYREAVGSVLSEELIHHVTFQVGGFDEAAESIATNAPLRKFVGKALNAYYIEDEEAAYSVSPSALKSDTSLRQLGFGEAIRMIAQNEVFGHLRESKTGILMKRDREALEAFRQELPEYRRQILSGVMGNAAKFQLAEVENSLRESAATESDETVFENGFAVRQYVSGRYDRIAKGLDTTIFPNFGPHTAVYFPKGPQGDHYIEYNPRDLVGLSSDQVDAIMREELIHAASGYVLQKRGESFDTFFEDLGKSLSKEQRKLLKGVYGKGANRSANAGAEFFRVGVQRLLYGSITEVEIRTSAFQKIIALLRSVVDFFKASAKPDVKEVYDATVAILKKVDAVALKNSRRANVPEVPNYPAESAPIFDAASTYLDGYQQLLKSLQNSELRSWKEKSKFLTDAEKAKQWRENTRRTFLEIYSKMPSEKEFAAVAIGGQAKRGWYENSTKALIQVFGTDATRFAALLAATSPQTSVENNLVNALNIWKNWIAEGRPVDRDSIVRVMGASVMGNKGEDSVLDAWINNSVRALSSEAPEELVISGPKVNSFMLNLRGYVNEVTNDAWMANFALVDQTIFSGSLNKEETDPGKRPGYLAMSARVRAAANYLTQLTGETWTPAEVQETVWSWAKTLYELQERKGETRSALEILQAGELTDEAIASTPDFATLLNDGDYKQILEEAGYGEALAGLVGLNDGPDASGKPRFAPEAGTPVAEAIRRGQEQAASRLSRLYRVRQKEAAQRAASSSVLESSPLFQAAPPPGFEPTVFGPESRKTTSALRRLKDDPDFAPVARALGDKTYISWTEAETKSKAYEFIDVSHGGDLNMAFLASQKGSGLSAEQAIAVQIIALKRAQTAANAAQDGANKLAVQAGAVSDDKVKTELYRKMNTLNSAREMYQTMATSFGAYLMDNASVAGQELRAYRMLADVLSPVHWADTYKAAIRKSQQRKLEKNKLAKQITSQVREARKRAADKTASRIEAALAVAARRSMPKDASPEEVAAAELLAREFSSALPVKERIVNAAVEDVVIQGLATIKRLLSPDQQEDPSILDPWESRLRKMAAEQINAIIEERSKAGTVDPEPTVPKTQEQLQAEKEEEIDELWRAISDLPIAETVFEAAKNTITEADTPYANLIRSAQFDPERSSALKKAVRSTILISDEIRKTASNRNISVRSLQGKLADLNPSLTDSQREALASAIEAIYNEEVNVAARAALNRIVEASKLPKASKVLDRRTVEDILPLVNMGAFSDEAVYNAIADKFGLPVWDPAVAADIEKKATELQSLPEGSLQRLEAAQTLGLDILKENIKASKGFTRLRHLNQIAAAIWSASILSGPPTQIVNAGATSVSVFLESFMEAVGHYTEARTKGISHKEAFEFFKDIGRAWKFSFGKAGDNTSVRAITEAFSSLKSGKSKFKTEKLEDLSILEAFKFDESVAIPGNAMMDAIVNKEWKKAGVQALKTAAGVGVGGLSSAVLGPLAIPIMAAENSIRRAAGQNRQGAMRAYAANLKVVTRLMAASDAVNSTIASSAKQFMMARSLALLDPEASQEEIAKRIKAIGVASDAETAERAREIADEEEALGNFGPIGSTDARIAKARRIEQLIEQETYGPEALQSGRDFAALATFNSEPYGVIGAFMVSFFGGLNRMFGMAAKPLNPFPKTISNLLNASMNYTPYGSLRAQGWNLGRGLIDEESVYYKEPPEQGSAEYFALHARAIAGTAFLTAVMYMLKSSWEERKQGRVPLFEVHGTGPQDPVKRGQFTASGAKAFTVRMGNAQFRYTDWPGINIALGAIGTVYDNIVWGNAELDPVDWMFSVGASVAGTTLNRNMLGGASALFDVLSTGTPQQVKQAAAGKLGSSYIGGFTKPSFARWLETVGSGTFPETRTQEGWLLSLFPVAGSLRGKPALNILGEPIKVTPAEATVGRLANVYKPHPILSPLTLAQLWVSPAERYKIHDPTSETGARKMTSEEFYEYTLVYGKTLREFLSPDVVDNLVNVAQQDQQAAQDRLTEICGYARKAAQGQMGILRAKRR